MIFLNLIYSVVDRIGNKLNILIVSPNYRSFGNCSEMILFALHHCMDRNKKMIIIKPFNSFFFKKVSIANQYLYQLEHELIIKPPFLISSLFSFLMTILTGFFFIFVKSRKILAKICNLSDNYYNNHELACFVTQQFGWKDVWELSEDLEYVKKRWHELENKYKPPMLPKYLEINSKRAVELIAPESINKKWVTIHAVDNTIVNRARGAKIDSYNLAIKYLVENDFHIFRIGDNSMPKCKEIIGLTDLAHIDHDRSLDLYLIQNVDFHIGVQSGPNFVGHLFNKDVLQTNLVEWSTAIPRKKNNFYIMKKFIKKSSNTIIPISELLEKSFNFQINTNSIGDKDLYIEDNSDLEILEVVKEFLNFKKNVSNYSALQEKFNKKKNSWLLNELSNEDLVVDFWPSNNHNLNRIRSFAMSTVSGTMSNFFLKENW